MATPRHTADQRRVLPSAMVPPAPRLFRFTLRQMLAIVALTSVVLTAVVSTDGITALALLLAALVITAHVLSTALGSQLRSHSDAVRSHQHLSQPGFAAPDSRRWVAASQANDAESRSPWHRRGSTPMPWLPWLVAAVAVVGAILGGLVLSMTIGPRNSPAGLVVGMFSVAIVSGWFAFLSGSFYAILRHGLRDAAAERHENLPPPR